MGLHSTPKYEIYRSLPSSLEATTAKTTAALKPAPITADAARDDDFSSRDNDFLSRDNDFSARDDAFSLKDDAVELADDALPSRDNAGASADVADASLDNDFPSAESLRWCAGIVRQGIFNVPSRLIVIRSNKS